MSKKKFLIIHSSISVLGVIGFIISLLVFKNKYIAFPFLLATQIIDLFWAYSIG